MSESEDTVRSLSPTLILNQFFEIIFGEQKGWAYTATKEPQEDGKGAWEKRFFRYPDQKEEMIIFLIVSSAEKDVYYSPALYKNDRSNPQDHLTREDFLGTSWVWADFDNGLPDAEKLVSIPEPTMKIRSSKDKRQHWYWNLNFFENNPDALEKITKALTYHLGADLSGWDYQQVLRPPATIHHKSGKQVSIIKATDSKVSIEAFMDIPEVPDHIWDVDIDEEKLTDALDVLLLYPIKNPNDRQLVRKPSQPVGQRSSALTRVGYVCAQAGMTNTEIYAVLLSCDRRWKKFEPRGEHAQKKNLIKIIRYVRQKYPLNIKDEDSDDELPYYTYGEFAQMKISVEWIVDGLIQKNGIPAITGSGNVGKTHMTFQMACHMVTGKKFLMWEFARPMTLCIVSNELAPAETKEELDKIVAQFTPEEQAVIRKNLHVIPLGTRLALNKVKEQDKLLRQFEAHHPEGIFFDSLGQSVSEGLSNDETINDTFDFVKKRINQHYDAFTWFIHHMRKGQAGNKKPKDPDDVYGSGYIFNNCSTVVNLWKDNPSDSIIEFNFLKVRFAKFPENFKIRRIDPCGFEVVNNNYVDLSMSGKTNAGGPIDDIDF